MGRKAYHDLKKNNPERLLEITRRGYLMSRYGIAPEDVEHMRRMQDNKCAICRSELGSGRFVHVEHCHKTRKIRALTCNVCNVGLGIFRDNSALLREAADYIDRHAFRAKSHEWFMRKAA